MGVMSESLLVQRALKWDTGPIHVKNRFLHRRAKALTVLKVLPQRSDPQITNNTSTENTHMHAHVCTHTHTNAHIETRVINILSTTVGLFRAASSSEKTDCIQHTYIKDVHNSRKH